MVLIEALSTLTTAVGPTGVSIFRTQETEKLKLILASNPGFRVTPAILRGFIGFSSPHDVEELRAEIRSLQEENAGLLRKLAKNCERSGSDKDMEPTLQQPVDTPAEQSDQPPAYDDGRGVAIRPLDDGAQPNSYHEAPEEAHTGVETHCENSATHVDKASQSDLEGTHNPVFKIDVAPQCRCFSTKSIITIIGGAVLLYLLMWSAVFAHTYDTRGFAYQDRRLWNSFNAEYPTGEGIIVSQARCAVGVWGFSDWTTVGARGQPSPT